MKIQDIMLFNECVEQPKSINAQKMTVGRAILNLIEKAGIFVGEVKHQRETERDFNLADVRAIVDFQLSISMLYNLLKKGNLSISDKAVIQMLTGASDNVVKEYKGTDYIWVIFRIQSAIGEVAGKFNIRTQPQEYQYLVQTLVKVQAYTMYYMRYILSKVDDHGFDSIYKDIISPQFAISPVLVAKLKSIFNNTYVEEPEAPQIRNIIVPDGLPLPNINSETVEKSYTTTEEVPVMIPQQSLEPAKTTPPPPTQGIPLPPEIINTTAPDNNPTQRPVVEGKTNSKVDDILNDIFPDIPLPNIPPQLQNNNKPSNVKHDVKPPVNAPNTLPLPEPAMLARLRETMGVTEKPEVVGQYDPSKDGEIDI